MERWIEPAMWVGILAGNSIVGLVIRKGVFDFNGERCFVCINDIRVEAREIKATERTLYCVSLSDIGYLLPADAVWALGWTADGRYAFNYRGAPAVLCESARKGFSGGLRTLPAAQWHRQWTERLYKNPDYSPFSFNVAKSKAPVNRVRRRGEACQNMR